MASGHPCSNCRLAQTECIIYERKKRRTLQPPQSAPDFSMQSEKGFVTGSNLNDMSEKEELLPTTPNQGSFLKPNIQQKFPHLSVRYLNPNTVFKEEMRELMQLELNHESNPTMKPIYENSVKMITENKRTRSYNLDQMDFEVLNMFGCLSLPNEETCWMYIDSFFNNLNTQYPIINKKIFYRDYKDLMNPPSLLLLNSVLFLGAWHFIGSPEQKEESLQIAEVFFKRAKLLYDYGIEIKPIPLVQSLMCFVFHWDNMSSMSKNDFYWTKMAITVAYQYGFHEVTNSGDLYERRMRLQLWWMLVVKDRISSLGFSKPLMIDMNHNTIRSLQYEDLQDSDMSEKEQSYLIQLTKLAILIGKIIEEQSEMNKLHSQGKPILKQMKKCDNMMISYLRDVPKELKTKLDDSSTHHFLSILLSSSYYATLVLIHKANIMRNTADNYPSWSISFQASQIIKAIMDCFSKKSMVGRTAFFPHNVMSSSAVIMMYHLYNKDERISKIANEFFIKVLSIWEHSCKKWQGCYPLLCVFGQIYNSEDAKKGLLDSFTKTGDGASLNPFGAPDMSIVLNANSNVDVKHQSPNIAEFGVDFDKLFADKVFLPDNSGKPDLDFIKNSKSTVFHAESVGTSRKRDNLQPADAKQEPVFSEGEVTKMQLAPTFAGRDSSLWMLQKDWQPRFNVGMDVNAPQMPPTVSTNDQSNSQSHSDLQQMPPPHLPVLRHGIYPSFQQPMNMHHQVPMPVPVPYTQIPPHNMYYGGATNYHGPVDGGMRHHHGPGGHVGPAQEIVGLSLPPGQEVYHASINAEDVPAAGGLQREDDGESFINPFSENKDPFAYFKNF